MKYIIPLLLAAVLLLSIPGCGFLQEPEKTETIASVVLTEAPEPPTTEPPATAAPVPAADPVTETTKPPKYYPETIGDALLVEGEPEALMMDLFDGGNYVIYIIQNMWTLETSLTDGYLVDRWYLTVNDMIDLQVISFGDLTEDEAGNYIQESFSGYQIHDGEEPGYISGLNNTTHYFLNGRICSDGKNTFGIIARFPMEAADGMFGRTMKMIRTFEIK